ncbi:MAG: GtrA family protein [Gammaproteobacteria bacterium]|nr:GtrA family protein [Gammaproteobacteria bacterium]
MTKQQSLIQTIGQLMRFGIIGVLAALTHYAIAITLTHRGMLPAWANLIAFVTAFWVSYFGHRYFSFDAGDVSHQQTLPRFILVAVLGFILNESLLLLMLHFTSITIALGLPFIIILTAIFTFILSRQFAFDTSNSRTE